MKFKNLGGSILAITILKTIIQHKNMEQVDFAEIFSGIDKLNYIKNSELLEDYRHYLEYVQGVMEGKQPDLPEPLSMRYQHVQPLDPMSYIRPKLQLKETKLVYLPFNIKLDEIIL